MRGDLEILGYNMLHWLTGELPWEKAIKQPKTVQTMKETFMKSVRSSIKSQFPNVPGKSNKNTVVKNIHRSKAHHQNCL